jgi:hypothetical protein
MYSGDGGATWLPLAVDATEQALSVDTSHLEGDELLVRVFASDGLNTTIETVGPVGLSQGTPRLWGDLDCDGGLTTRDNQALLRRILQQNPLSQTEPCPALGAVVDVSGTGDRAWGDLDCDGDITTRDNQALQRRVLQQAALSQTQPCPALGSTVGVRE